MKRVMGVDSGDGFTLCMCLIPLGSTVKILKVLDFTLCVLQHDLKMLPQLDVGLTSTALGCLMLFKSQAKMFLITSIHFLCQHIQGLGDGLGP